MGGDADKSDGRGLRVFGTGRRRIEPLFRGAYKLRAGALPAEQPLVGSPDAIADLEAPSAGPRRFDNAGDVGPRDERLRQVHRDDAAPDVEVDRVESRS